MKKITAYITIAVLLFAAANTANAQSDVQLKIGYNANMPAGSFKDFMGNNSYRGFNAELSLPVSNQLRLGLGVAHSDYNEKFDRQVIPGKDGDISAVITHSIQTTPILFKADYTLLPSSTIRPYVGLGAGFNVIRFNQYLGEFNGSDKSSFKPALSADAGVNIPFNKIRGTSGINVGANYNYMPFKYDVIDNLNNWGVHAGVYFPL